MARTGHAGAVRRLLQLMVERTCRSSEPTSDLDPTQTLSRGAALHLMVSGRTCLNMGSLGALMAKHRIYTTSFASVYPLYVAKAEKKGRTKAEVDRVISWLTGYGQKELETQLEKQTDFETFFAKAPKINPSRALIKGVVCGVRV